MSELAVTVVGRDRPGIIADVTQVLAGLGLSLTDSTMTLLRGHFAMTLICAGDVDPELVAQELRPLSVDGALQVTVARVQPEEAQEPLGTPYVLTVHGADRLGIVAAVTRAVAAAGGNITDLTTRLTGDLYLLVAEVDLPPGCDIDALRGQLVTVAGRLDVYAALRPAEADLL